MNNPRPKNQIVADYVRDHLNIAVDRDLGGRVFPISICGLCGNTGIIDLPARKTPWGAEIPAARTFCLCPNGQDDAAYGGPTEPA
jgi:hypothetical protein